MTGDEGSEKIEMAFTVGFVLVPAKRKLVCVGTRMVTSE
jgi:hypothetical protein